MLYQESTFHDRQCVIFQTPQATSSTTPVDITGAALTTKDLGSTGTYLGWFSVLISSTLNNTTVIFSVLVDGVPSGPGRSIFLKVKDLDIGFTIMDCRTSEKDVDITLQWETDQGTVTLSEYGIIIDGVPSYRVVE